MIITLKIENEDNLIACDINELQVELDEENKKIKLYRNGELLGNCIEFFGIDEDEFIKTLAKKEN